MKTNNYFILGKVFSVVDVSLFKTTVKVLAKLFFWVKAIQFKRNIQYLINSEKAFKFSIIVLPLLLFSYSGYGAIRTASASGFWNNTATWGGAAVPTAADTVTINSPFTVTIDVAAPVAGSLSGNGTISCNTTAILTIGANNSNSLFLGIIQDGTGSISLTKNGTGILTLSGANAYSGATLISAGSLQLGSASALGTTVTITVSNGAVLDLNGFTLGAALPLTLNGTGISNGGALINSSTTTATFSGLITLGSSSSIIGDIGTINISNVGTVTGSGFGLIIGGAVGGTLTSNIGTGTGTLTKQGAGIWIVSGANTYSGATTISAGTLQLGAVGAIPNVSAMIDNGILDLAGYNETIGSLAGSGIVESTNAISVTLTTGGDNTNTTFSGIIQNGAGTISLIKNGTGAFTLSGNNTYSGSTTLSAGTLNINSATAIGSGTFIINAGVTIDNTSGGLITLSNNNLQTWNGNFAYTGTNNLNLGTGAVSITTNCQVTINGGSLTVGGVISGAFGLTKLGAGTFILSGANLYTSGTTLIAGTLLLNNTAALGAAGASVILNGGTLDLATDASVNAYNVTVGGSATIASDKATASSAGIIHTLGTLSIGNQTLTIAGGSNVNSGTAGITFGATSFSGSPTFTINNPTGGITQFSVAAVSPAGYDATINGNGNMVQTDVWGATAGGITYSGTGTLTLNQANTFTGALTVNNGTVVGTANANALGAGTLVLAGGILKLAHSGGLNFGNNTTVSGNAQITSDVTTSGNGVIYTLGTLSIGNQTLTIAGGSNVIGGTAGITFGATNFTGAPTFTINNPGGGGVTQLSVDAVNNGSNSATISGNGNMIQTGIWGNGSGGIIYGGTGTLTLNQANTYTGTTMFSSGQLNINNATALGTGTFIISAGSIIDNTSGGTITLSNNNTQVWNGDFTFSGTQNLNLGSGAVVMNANCQITVSANTLIVGGIISGTTYNLTKAGSGTLTFGASNVNINNLTISAGNLTAPSATLNIANNFSNSGTFTNNNGTVNFNGSGPQAIAGVIFNNLTLSNGGNKNLQGTTTVAGTLALASGVLQLGNNNLSLSGTSGTAAITGSFSNTSMIETDGTGLLSFTNAALPNSALNGTYPVGNNGDYNPVIITGLAGGAANRTFNISVDTGRLFENGINRYWTINQTNVTGTASLSFQYNNSEASSDFTKYQPYTNVTGNWVLAPSASAKGVNPITSTITTDLPASSQWTAATPGAFYSYQSGDWNNPTTWTTDPGGNNINKST